MLLALCIVCTYSVAPENGNVYAASKKSSPKSITLKYKSTKLNNGSYTVKKGKSIQLKATVLPKKADRSAKIVWKSSNKKIVAVTSKGKIKAKKVGKATITATLKGTKEKAKVTICVGTPVKKVTVATGSVTLEEGQTHQIKARVNPKNAKVKGVKYTSSNKSIATVTSKGVVKAVAPGKAIITVQPKDLAGKAAKVTLTVYEKAPTPSPSPTPTPSPSPTPTPSPSPTPTPKHMVSSIELSRYSCYVALGKTFKVDAAVYPENAANKKLTWTSDDPSIATVDQNGLITAVETGYTFITVSASDGSGVYEEIDVYVREEYLSVYDWETYNSCEDGDTIVLHEGMPKRLEVNAFEQDYNGSIDVTSDAGSSLVVSDPDEEYQYGDVYRSIELNPSSGADGKTLTISYGSFTKSFKLKVFRQFPLEFESNGGETFASMMIFEDTKLRLPSPFREKYVFKGWYLDSGFSNKVEDGSILEYKDGGYTLYADWEEEYLVLNPSNLNIEAEDINTGLYGTFSTNGIIDEISYVLYDENDDEKTSGTAIIGSGDWGIETLGISPGNNRVVVKAVTTAETEAQAEVTLTYDRGEIEYEFSEDTVVGLEEEGVAPFINNRLDIFFEEDVSEDEADLVFKEIGATKIGYLRTINMYQVELEQSYNTIEKLIEYAESVTNKYEEITLAEPEFLVQNEDQTIYNDSWSNADWDVSNPSGANWWAEAINAPGAWNYVSKM